MKKSVLALAMAFGVTSAFAQDLTSKKGEPILPEAGDWAISADATPFLNYMGNFFGKTSNNAAPTMNFLGSNSLIMGKYFKDEKTAYRVGLNIGLNTQTVKNLVAQDQPSPATPPPGTAPTMVTDKSVFSTTGIGITAGIEKRKGKTRLQGYYGAELGFYIASQKQTNTYGNAFAGTGTSPGTSPTPMSTTWNSAAVDAAAPNNGVPSFSGAAAAASRVTSDKLGMNFQFGVRAFIGAEYFVLPKMSLGGEFGWGLGFSTTAGGTQVTEAIYTGTSPSSMTTKTGGSSAFILGANNRNSMFGPSGSLRANFYF